MKSSQCPTVWLPESLVRNRKKSEEEALHHLFLSSSLWQLTASDSVTIQASVSQTPVQQVTWDKLRVDAETTRVMHFLFLLVQNISSWRNTTTGQTQIRQDPPARSLSGPQTLDEPTGGFRLKGTRGQGDSGSAGGTGGSLILWWFYIYFHWLFCILLKRLHPLVTLLISILTFNREEVFSYDVFLR